MAPHYTDSEVMAIFMAGGAAATRECRDGRQEEASYAEHVRQSKMMVFPASLSDQLTDIEKECIVRASAFNIYNARELILDELYADYEEQFTRFTQFSRLLREVNKTAVVEIATKNGVFDKLFVSVVSSDDKELFIKLFLRVVAMDGAHSKHRRYGGTMLILQALTAKKQTVTLAFALVPSESKESWDFFISLCKRAGHTWCFKEDNVIFSDRDKGLIPALASSSCHHHYCAKPHLVGNVREACRKKGGHQSLGKGDSYFWNIVKATSKPQFDAAMAQLKGPLQAQKDHFWSTSGKNP
ncbi:ribonucleoprotein [Pycnococcus provasolii]